MDRKEMEMELNKYSAKHVLLTKKKAETQAKLQRKYAELCDERDKELAEVDAQLHTNNGTLMFLKTKLDDIKKRALDPATVASRAEAQFKTSGRNTPAPSPSTSPKPPSPYCGPGVTQSKRQWLASNPSSRPLTSGPSASVSSPPTSMSATRPSVSSRPVTPPIFDLDTDDFIANVHYDYIGPTSDSTTKKSDRLMNRKTYPAPGKRAATTPATSTKRKKGAAHK